MDLKTWRIDVGRLTQSELARRLGVDQAHLSKIERKTVVPSVRFVLDVQNLTAGKVQIQDLVDAATAPSRRGRRGRRGPRASTAARATE